MELEYIRKCQQGSSGYVSALYQCSTENATWLCFYNISDKLKAPSIYDIGGTYTEEQPHFWFYYTTSACHGFNFLMNLFVLPRKPGSFSLFLPKSYKLTEQIKSNDVNIAILYGQQTSQLTFRTTHKDEHVFVKTFQFDAGNVNSLQNCSLLMPFMIEVHSKLQLDTNTVRAIKLRHDLSCLMAQKEGKDFMLVSNSGTKYPVHKLLLAAHSPVLRTYLNNPGQHQAMDISDDAMNIILEFLYTGTLKQLYKLDCIMLLGIAERFKFQQLFALAQQILGEDITVDNAVDIAVLAKKYNLDKLTYKVFDFIKECPEALTTDSWLGLQDIDLVKQLLQHLHPPSYKVD